MEWERSCIVLSCVIIGRAVRRINAGNDRRQ